MAISLPGPDRPTKKPRPRVRVPRGKKPPKRKTTPGKIVYRTPKPPKQRGTMPSPVYKAPPTTPQHTGPVNPDPYARWREWAPWAIQGASQIKFDQRSHQAYVSDKVMPWLSNSLNLLNAYNTDAQNTMLGGIQGAGGAYGVSAAMTPLNVSSNATGGAVVGPNSYLTQAGKDYALGTGNVATALANSQAALNKMQPVSLSQGYINALADRAAGLPALYSKRLSEYTANVEQFIGEAQAAAAEAAAEQAQWEAEFTEKSRHNRVTEAISATNSQTNAAIQLGRLGLDASDQAFDNSPDPRVGAAPPPGYFRDVDGRLVRDPTVSASGTGRGKTPKGTYAVNELRKQGFVGGWKVKPKNKPAGAKGTFVKAANGTWWIKPAGASGSGTPSVPRDSAFSLSESLLKSFGREGDGGLADTRFPDDPQGGGKWIASWVREKKSQFVGKNRRVDLSKLMAVLDSIGGRPGNIALDILQRGYMKKVGGVWYWK
jgi:hypothetical protein